MPSVFQQMARQVYGAEPYSLTGKIENIVGMSIEASGGVNGLAQGVDDPPPEELPHLEGELTPGVPDEVPRRDPVHVRVGHEQDVAPASLRCPTRSWTPARPPSWTTCAPSSWTPEPAPGGSTSFESDRADRAAVRDAGIWVSRLASHSAI